MSIKIAHPLTCPGLLLCAGLWATLMFNPHCKLSKQELLFQFHWWRKLKWPAAKIPKLEISILGSGIQFAVDSYARDGENEHEGLLTELEIQYVATITSTDDDKDDDDARPCISVWGTERNETDVVRGLRDLTSWCKVHATHILLLFGHSVVSNSLQPHGLQHSRFPCPSPSIHIQITL